MGRRIVVTTPAAMTLIVRPSSPSTICAMLLLAKKSSMPSSVPNTSNAPPQTSTSAMVLFPAISASVPQPVYMNSMSVASGPEIFEFALVLGLTSTVPPPVSMIFTSVCGRLRHLVSMTLVLGRKLRPVLERALPPEAILAGTLMVNAHVCAT